MQRLLKILIWMMVALFISGCVQQAEPRYGAGTVYHEGPPPHAPAHGYRYQYRNHDLRYDSSLGAYVVIGWQNYFYNDGFYFHYLDGRWLFSARLDSNDWHQARREQLPPNLYRSHEQHDRRDDRHDKKVPPGQAKKWDREHDEDDYYRH